ncbi:hypothetical protein HY732_04995 [Candidatus Uhrbacteria bacterium]|nr:hypothetical protein [Candidatus Uhrbacteria bacterium]
MTTLTIWALLSFKLPISPVSLLLTQIVMAGGLFYRAKLKGILAEENPQPLFSRIKFEPCVALILILAAFSAIFNLFFPVYVTDGIFYKLYGEIAVQAQTIASVKDLVAEIENRSLGFHLLSGYFLLFDVKTPEIVQSFFYLSLLGLFYNALKKSIGPGLAKKLTLLLAVSPMIFWHSLLYLNNLQSGFYFFCGSLYWFFFIRSKEPRYLQASSFSFMLASWIRYENLVFYLVPLALTLFFTIRHKTNKAFFYLWLIPSIFSGCWTIFSLAYYPELRVTHQYLALFLLLAIGGGLCAIACAKGFAREFALIALLAVIFGGGVFIALGGPEQKDLFAKLITVFSIRLYLNILNKIGWGTGMILILLLPFLYSLMENSEKLLLWNLAVTFLLSMAVLSLFFKATSLDGKSFGEITRFFLQNIGGNINKPSNREFFQIFPTLLFLAGVCCFAPKNSAHPGRPFLTKVLSLEKKIAGVFFLILANLVVIFAIFILPRTVFMKNHLGHSHFQLQESAGVYDSPNLYWPIYKIAHVIKALTEKSAFIILPTQEKLPGAEPPFDLMRIPPLQDTLYPRHLLWGMDDLKRLKPAGGQKIYLVTHKNWLGNKCMRHPQGQSLNLESWFICPLPPEIDPRD